MPIPPVPLLTPRTPAEKPPGLVGSMVPSTPVTASAALLPFEVEVAVPFIAAGRAGPKFSKGLVLVTSMTDGSGDESVAMRSGSSSEKTVPARSRPVPAL